MEESSIDLRELVGILLNHLKMIIKIMIGCIVLAVIYLVLASPVYESDALLRIKQQRGLGDSILTAATGGNAQMTQQQMSTYAEILKSRSVVVPVIEATEIQKNGKYPGYDGYVKGRITTVPFKNTEILKVTVNANTADKAQKANQLLVSGFLDRLTELSRTEQTATKKFLEGRTQEAKGELGKTEEALQAYKAKHKIITPTDSAKLFTDQISEIDKQAAANQVDLQAAQARLDAINGQLGGEGRATADNTTIKAYNTQLAQLEAAKISYADKYTAKHPKMIDITNQIAALRGKIKNEIAKVASLQAPSDNAVHQGLIAGKFQSEGEIAVAQQKAAALAKIQAKNSADLTKLSTVEQGYVKVARDASVANEIYVMLAKRLEEAKVAEVMVPNDVQVVDNATLPEAPVRPRKALTLVLAALLGLLLGCGLAVAGELLNRKVKTEEDITNYLNLPVLGTVPEEASLNKAMDYGRKHVPKKGLLAKLRGFVWKQ